MAPAISDRHFECFASFTKLVSAVEKSDRAFEDQAPTQAVLNEFDRYKVWAGNMGAAHFGKRYPISLDYRLREASFYKDQVSP